MNGNRALRIVAALSALVVVLVLAIVLGGCSLRVTTTTTGQSTTTTVAGQQTPADQAIAAVTKSANITVPAVLKSGALLAGSDETYPPLEFLDKSRRVVGFDVDLCSAIAKKMGLTLEVLPKEYKDLVPGLNGNQYDLIMSALPMTSDLGAKLDFTTAYLPGLLSIVAPAGSPIADSAGLSDKVVGVQTGSFAQTQLATVTGVKQIKTYDRVLDAFSDLNKETINAVVTDQPIAAYVLSSYATYKSTLVTGGTIQTGVGVGYGVKKGNTALVTAMNAALAELRSDGVYKLICDKWSVTGN